MGASCRYELQETDEMSHRKCRRIGLRNHFRQSLRKSRCCIVAEVAALCGRNVEKAHRKNACLSLGSVTVG